MRQDLKNDVKDKLATVAEVKHFALWNHNVEYITDESPWERPAVFLEIGDISWSSVKGGALRGRGTLRLHIVTDYTDEASESAAWELSENLRGVLEGMSGKGYDSICLQTTMTNHNHEDILESIDEYSVRWSAE